MMTMGMWNDENGEKCLTKNMHFLILSVLRPNSLDHFPYQLRTDAYRSQRVHSLGCCPIYAA